MHHKEIMLEAARIISKKRTQILSEKFVQDNSPSVEFNDFIGDARDILFKIEQLFIRNANNRNLMTPDAQELLQQLRDRTDLCLERIKISPPEDVNEDKDLIGASILGIGGEEKLANLSRSREAQDGFMYFYDNDNAEISKIKELRMGKAEAPFFCQIGGWYYPCTPLKGKSDVMKAILRVNKDEKMSKRDAMSKIQAFQASAEKPAVKQSLP